MSFLPSLFCRCYIFFFLTRQPSITTLFPYTTLFRSVIELARQKRREDIVDFYARDGARMTAHPAEPHDGGVRCLRSEEHTSELQSRGHLVCRLLLEKKKKHILSRHIEINKITS